MDKNDKLHDSSNDEKTSSKDEHFVTPNKGRNIKKNSPDKNKLDRTKDESGDDNMENVVEREILKSNNDISYVKVEDNEIMNAINRSHKKHKKMMRKLSD